MSHRRKISKRLEALSDIAGIMSAMKGLALMEIRILKDFLICQQQMVTSIEHTATEFFTAYPELICTTQTKQNICIIVGSEQGFCGDFNETLLTEMGKLFPTQAASTSLIIVGRRLAGRMNDDPSAKLTMPGAVVADEIPTVLLHLTQQLSQLVSQERVADCGFSVLYHCDAANTIRWRHLLPLRNAASITSNSGYSPDLTIPPNEFLIKLMDHYLYAVLNEVLYSSLMAENNQRQEHMDRALQRLDEDQTKLQLTYNIQRQEDITEEIETILLSIDMPETEN
jgi:F0F1-type ATP synthase, gamma subunit